MVSMTSAPARAGTISVHLVMIDSAVAGSGAVSH
jgi:hypothetical protein